MFLDSKIIDMLGFMDDSDNMYFIIFLTFHYCCRYKRDPWIFHQYKLCNKSVLFLFEHTCREKRPMYREMLKSFDIRDAMIDLMMLIYEYSDYQEECSSQKIEIDILIDESIQDMPEYEDQ